MSLVSHLKDAEKIELTDNQIHQITKGRCLPMPYHRLHSITDINQLFAKKQHIMLLYEMEENVGHWVLLSKLDKDTLLFFDPYGLNVDEELAVAKYNSRIHKGQIVPHLTHLLQNSTYNVEVNTTRYQKVLKDINTCGRHCAIRALFSDLDPEQYKQLMMNNRHYDPDIWVTALSITYSL
jgi:hypothetical protein